MKKILFALATLAAFAVAGCTPSAGEQEVRVVSYNIRYLNQKDGDNGWVTTLETFTSISAGQLSKRS